MKWLALGLLLAGGCGKTTHVDSPATVAAADQVVPPGAPANDDGFIKGWEAVSMGGQANASSGDWSFEKATDGAVIATRNVQRVAGTGESGDAQVKAALAQNEKINAEPIDVTVSDRTATLRGTVTSSGEAAAAIRTALDTEGVDRVVSYLSWQSLP